MVDAVDLIRNAQLEDLQNVEWIENHLLLELGINDEYLEHFPQHLYPYCGKGLKFWQYPNQFSRYLANLSTKNIRSYLEIGCRHGSTFVITVEYLSRFKKIERAVGVDIDEQPMMRDYIDRYGSEVWDYKIISSHSQEFKSYIATHKFDLCLIDGDHSKMACLADYMAVKDHARLIAFHDIVSFTCPGVIEVWNNLKRTLPACRMYEFTQQYPDVVERIQNHLLGLGIVDFS